MVNVLEVPCTPHTLSHANHLSHAKSINATFTSLEIFVFIIACCKLQCQYQFIYLMQNILSIKSLINIVILGNIGHMIKLLHRCLLLGLFLLVFLTFFPFDLINFLIFKHSMFPKSNHETFSQKLYQTFKNHKRFTKPKLARSDFTIVHYAGDVSLSFF